MNANPNFNRDPNPNANAKPNGSELKLVYTVVDRGPGKSFWVRVGIGSTNRDGSLNLKLDAIPTNGKLQVRDWQPERDQSPYDGTPPPAFSRGGPRDAGHADAGPSRRGGGDPGHLPGMNGGGSGGLA